MSAESWPSILQSPNVIRQMENIGYGRIQNYSLPPNVRLTLSVTTEARNSTPTESSDFHTASLAKLPQIRANANTVAATIETIQIVKQILFRFRKSIMTLRTLSRTFHGSR
jgi:hypothetical protein